MNPKELNQTSELFMCLKDTDIESAFELIKKNGAPYELITELFVIYQLGNTVQSKEAKVFLKPQIVTSIGLKQVLNKNFLTEWSTRKDIKNLVKKCPDLNPLKMALALFYKYEAGLQYLISELSDKELENLLKVYINNGNFEIREKNINKIPSFLFKNYRNLLKLDLQNNEIKTIPAAIGKMIDLKKINLIGNKLNKLNKSIGKLSHLEELLLSFNEITELPKEISNLKGLKILELISNPIEEFPEVIAEFTNLEQLSLSVFGEPIPISNSFFNLKAEKLIKLEFNNTPQEKWSNLPRITSVTGTYENPINTNSLSLAERAYSQNKEGLGYLLEHAPSERIHEILPTLIENNNTIKLKKVYLNKLPNEIKAYNITAFIAEEILLCKKEVWQSFLNMPKLEILDFGLSSNYRWVDDIYSIGEEDSFPLEILKKLPKLVKLNLGTMIFSDTLEQIPKFPNLEDLCFFQQDLFIENKEDFYKLDKLKGLKKLPKLKELCLRGVYSYDSEKPEYEEVKTAVVDYISKWLPKDCNIIIGGSDIANL